MKGVYIFLADGFEDIEAIAPRDVLNRGGVDVKLVSITDSLTVESSHGLKVLADMTLRDAGNGDSTKASDIMIFPGGMPGSKRLGACRNLISLMNHHYAQGGSVAAICAAPSFVLGQLELTDNPEPKIEFTCFDGCEENLIERGWTFLKRPAITCGRIITGRGSGHSIDFGLAILEHISGPAAAAAVSAKMTLPTE